MGMAGLLSLVIGGNMASEFITQKAVFAAAQLVFSRVFGINRQQSKSSDTWAAEGQSLQPSHVTTVTNRFSSFEKTLRCLGGSRIHRTQGLVPHQPALGPDYWWSALHWQQCHNGHWHLRKEVHHQGHFFHQREQM